MKPDINDLEESIMAVLPEPIEVVIEDYGIFYDESELEDMETKPKYWEIHVAGYKDKGYSIVVMADNEDEAVELAYGDDMFQYPADVDDIDYIEEITEEEFEEMGGSKKDYGY